MASLRLWLEALQGYVGTVILWDFTNPWPSNPAARDYDQGLPKIAERTPIKFVSGAGRFSWARGSEAYSWRAGSIVSANGFLAQGSLSADLINLPPSIPKFLRAGEYLQLNRRLYILAQDMDTDDSGFAVARLMTPTLEPLTQGMPVYFKEAGCEMRLAESDWTQGRSATDPFHSVSASFIETSRNYAAGGAQFAA